MTLPLLVSVPHAGTRVPSEVADLCLLSRDDIVADGDEQSAEIYFPLEDEVEAFVTTSIARAIVDVNRAEDDRRPDGVVKSETVWRVPVYREPPPEETVEALLARYHRPYHERLRELARAPVVAGVDCHTMAAAAPPIAREPGRARPPVCVSDAGGTCPPQWRDALVRRLEEHLGVEVRVNDPFRGGHVVRSHSPELPWVQLELSRGEVLPVERKRDGVRRALEAWCADLGEAGGA